MTSNESGSSEVNTLPSTQQNVPNANQLNQSSTPLRISPQKRNGKNMAIKRRLPDPFNGECIQYQDAADSSNPFLGIAKKRKTNGIGLVQQPKNTVAMLNELRQGLVYHLESQVGPVHAPVFTMIVEVSAIHWNKYIYEEFCQLQMD